MKSRQLLDRLFESDDVDADVARQAIRYYMSKGHDLEAAKEMAFKQDLPKPRPARPAGHAAQIRAAATRPKMEADFHSPEERQQLDATRKPGMSRMDKLRQRRPDLYPPRAKAMLMALPSVQGRGQ